MNVAGVAGWRSMLTSLYKSKLNKAHGVEDNEGKDTPGVPKILDAILAMLAELSEH